MFCSASAIAVTLCLILWRTPVPLTEAVAIRRRRPVRAHEVPGSRTPALPAGVLLHRIRDLAQRGRTGHAARVDRWRRSARWPRSLRLVLHVRLRRLLGGGGGAAVAVLVGSPGFQDNLEISLSYTTVCAPSRSGP